jgi:hypothetical protein
MSNTTISGNVDSDGGVGLGALLCMNGALNIRNSTIAFNRVGSGANAGIQLSGCALNIGNSIVAQNLAATNPDIQLSSGSITSVGGNLIGNTNGFPAGTFNQTNDQTGVDPLLGALQDNGGNVTTHSLLPGSPAINTGINANAVDPFDNSPLTTDARGAGFSRILGDTVDKGAYESQVLGTDNDDDNIPDTDDNCPSTSNADQADTDGDGQGDACDSDDDGDNIPDTCDVDSNPGATDFDNDGIVDSSSCDTEIGPPTTKDQCKDGGWMLFTTPRRFKNQGDCLQFVNKGK